jgi:hypothetical protein
MLISPEIGKRRRISSIIFEKGASPSLRSRATTSIGMIPLSQ